MPRSSDMGRPYLKSGNPYASRNARLPMMIVCPLVASWPRIYEQCLPIARIGSFPVSAPKGPGCPREGPGKTLNVCLRTSWVISADYDSVGLRHNRFISQRTELTPPEYPRVNQSPMQPWPAQLRLPHLEARARARSSLVPLGACGGSPSSTSTTGMRSIGLGRWTASPSS